jgi:hypothetical protein
VNVVPRKEESIVVKQNLESLNLNVAQKMSRTHRSPRNSEFGVMSDENKKSIRDYQDEVLKQKVHASSSRRLLTDSWWEEFIEMIERIED